MDDSWWPVQNFFVVPLFTKIVGALSHQTLLTPVVGRTFRETASHQDTRPFL